MKAWLGDVNSIVKGDAHSSVTRLRLELVAAFCTLRPLAIDPVKLIFQMFMCAAITAPVFPGPETDLESAKRSTIRLGIYPTDVNNPWREAGLFDEFSQSNGT